VNSVHRSGKAPGADYVGGEVIPNYCTDLNAMHEVEKTLVQEVEWVKYSVQLAKVTQAEWSDDMDYVCATARQRAEAFLRTLGKWEEGE
jgi:hypothetical protein